MKYIITIGRQYGSGGRFIGTKLAEELGIAFYDQELITKASEETGLSASILENYDERKEGFFTGVIPSTFSLDLTMGQKVFLAQFETIKKIAERESCIIVGRCGNYVLENYPNAVHIFIHAPFESRVQRAIKYYSVAPNKAKDVITKMDKKRANYYNFYTDKKWGTVESYDLTINSDVGVDECVSIIKNFIETKLKVNL